MSDRKARIGGSAGERLRAAVGAQTADTAPHDTRRRTLGYAAGLGAAAFAGFIPVIAKRDMGGIDPVLVAGLNNALAAAVILPLAPVPRFRAHDLRLVGAIALLGVVVAPVLYFTGLRQTSASEAAMLVNVETVGTLTFAVLLLRERAGTREVLAVLAAVAGAIVLATDLRADVSAAHLAGNLLIIAATLVWAMDNTVSAGLTRRNKPWAVAAWKNALGSAVMLAAAALLQLDFASAGPAWPSFVLVGGVGIGVSLTLFYVSMRHIDAYRTSAIFGLQGVFGAAAAFALLGERLSDVQLAGAGAMMAAVLSLALLHKGAVPAGAPDDAKAL